MQAIVTIDLESDTDELELADKISRVVAQALIPLINANVITEVSGVDTEIEEE